MAAVERSSYMGRLAGVGEDRPLAGPGPSAVTRPSPCLRVGVARHGERGGAALAAAPAPRRMGPFPQAETHLAAVGMDPHRPAFFGSIESFTHLSF